MIGPPSSLASIMSNYAFKDPAVANRFAEGIIKAGMPGRPSDYFPAYKENQLTEKEIKKLHKAIRRILSAAIENKGASVDTYYRPDGSRGTAHYQFKVAHRFKEPCYTCGTPIERIKVRQRGSYFCPKCQPEPKA